MKVFLFLAEGFEEIEAIAAIDIFRRADIEVLTISITDDKTVCGAHKVCVIADSIFDKTDFNTDFLIYLPGGLPGTTNLENHAGLKQLISKQVAKGNQLAAICAAPSILGKMGILKGKEAICYPGFEDQLLQSTISENSIVKSGTIYTAKAAGVAIQFALRIVEDLCGKEKANEIEKSIYLE